MAMTWTNPSRILAPARNDDAQGPSLSPSGHPAPIGDQDHAVGKCWVKFRRAMRDNRRPLDHNRADKCGTAMARPDLYFRRP